MPKTRSFEEREAPLQAIEHSALLRRLDAEESPTRSLSGRPDSQNVSPSSTIKRIRRMKP